MFASCVRFVLCGYRSLRVANLFVQRSHNLCVWGLETSTIRWLWTELGCSATEEKENGTPYGLVNSYRRF